MTRSTSKSPRKRKQWHSWFHSALVSISPSSNYRNWTISKWNCQNWWRPKFNYNQYRTDYILERCKNRPIQWQWRVSFQHVHTRSFLPLQIMWMCASLSDARSYTKCLSYLSKIVNLCHHTKKWATVFKSNSSTMYKRWAALKNAPLLTAGRGKGKFYGLFLSLD